MLLTLNGDDECEEEERGEDEGGEGFVRESHLVNSFNRCGKDEIKQCFTFTFRTWFSRKDLPVRLDADTLSTRVVSAMKI